MEEQWINDLRKKMASHQTPVPPGLWENIESALNEQKPVPMPLRKRVMMWTSAIGGIAAAVVLTFLLLGEDGGHEARMETPALAAILQKNGIVEAEEETAMVFGEQVEEQLSPISRPLRAQSTVASVPQAQAVPPEKRKLQPVEAKEQENGSQRQHDNKDPRPYRRSVAMKRNTQLLAKAVTVQQPKLAMQLYAGNLTHTSHHNSGYGELVRGSLLPNRQSNDKMPGMAPLKDIIYSNLGEDVRTRKKHKLPLKVGFSVRYHFHSRLGVETGLTYTYLASELSSGTDHHYFVTDQKLHYLGIPISLSYEVWKNKNWNFYLAAGGMLEKCIYGKSTTDYVLRNEVVDGKEEHVKEKPLQCSVHGALGAQLNLSSRIGLYIEPGVNYYFDNGSPVETIYKEQPLNFNFKLGLRFSFLKN